MTAEPSRLREGAEHREAGGFYSEVSDWCHPERGEAEPKDLYMEPCQEILR